MKPNKLYKSTKTLWIFCEGGTEWNYFQMLKKVERISRINIKSSSKTDCINIVKKADIFRKSSGDFEKGDRVFCVFDRDRNTDKQLTEAKKIASGGGIEIIYSNPSFELWLLLHYSLYKKQSEGDKVVVQLRKHLPNYRKADPNIYLKTRKRISIAISNAQIVRRAYREGMEEYVCRKSNPLTLVDKLIEAIHKLKD